MAGLFSSLTDQQLTDRQTALAEAVLTGTLTVVFQGQTVQYRKLDDMLKISDMICKEMASRGLIPADTRKSKVRVMTSSKGFKRGHVGVRGSES